MVDECGVLIRHGLLLDGSGVAGRLADIALADDRILAVGDLAGWRGDLEIDATGLVVAPGFIDVHTHDDWAALDTPSMPFKVTQGVTTVITGNCGASAAPFLPTGELPAPFSVINIRPEGCFPTMQAYASAVSRARPAINVASLVGHASLRVSVMGSDLDRRAMTAECDAMQEMLGEALRQGALGLSSGLDYPPALAASAEEMAGLAAVVGRHAGAVYTSHIRDEGDAVLEAVSEAIETGDRAGASLVISHHKCAGKRNFGRSVETLGRIEAARRRGQKVSLDLYPYVASSTALLWRFVRGAERVLVMWSDAEPDCAGRMLDDICADWGVGAEEAVARLDPAGAIYFDMDEGDLGRIMRYPPTMIGSDGLSGAARPHPRLWGTFPRVLGRYVREMQLLSLADAIRKMTGLSADTFGIRERGYLREGYKADVVVFDPATVTDAATFDEPEQPARGIHHVFVNGACVLTRGRQTAARPGVFIPGPGVLNG